MNIETVATLFASHVVILGIGITIGTMVVKNGLFEKVWDGIRYWKARRNHPQHHCPHIRVEHIGNETTVIDDFRRKDGNESSYVECQRCALTVPSHAHERWLIRDIPMWQSQPDKAEKQIRKVEKIARKNGRWTYLRDW